MGDEKPNGGLQATATPERLQALHAAGVLDSAALARALALRVASPPGAVWVSVLSVALLGVGAALLLAGVIFFFAYNWADLGRFARFALLEAAIAGAAIGAWRLGLQRLSGRVLLTAAAVLVGPLLAVYGQAYQTGADPFELFLGWAGLALPWAVLACFAPLWLILLLLLDTALCLYWAQVLGPGDGFGLFLALGAVHGAAWAVVVVLGRRGVAWLAASWLPRLLSLLLLASLTVPSLAAVLERDAGPLPWISLAALVGALVTLWRTHGPRPERPADVFVAAAGLAAVMGVATTAIGRLLFATDAESFAFIMLAGLITAELAGAARWLRALGRARSGE